MLGPFEIDCPAKTVCDSDVRDRSKGGPVTAKDGYPGQLTTAEGSEAGVLILAGFGESPCLGRL